MDAELLANVADESNRPHRCATIAVSITLGDELGADHAAGAGLVFGRLRSNMTNIAVLSETAQRAMEITDRLCGATRPKLAKIIISQNTKIR
jgi:hypothetical protein